MATSKREATVYLDPDVARAAKVRAARLDKRDSEVIEDALRAHLGNRGARRGAAPEHA
jgi:hypothetical protein